MVRATLIKGLLWNLLHSIWSKWRQRQPFPIVPVLDVLNWNTWQSQLVWRGVTAIKLPGGANLAEEIDRIDSKVILFMIFEPTAVVIVRKGEYKNIFT